MGPGSAVTAQASIDGLITRVICGIAHQVSRPIGNTMK